MEYRDLREWLEKVEKMGELKEIKGADWDIEIGAITKVSGSMNNPRALLFDEIKGYPPGYRVLTNSLSSMKRLALTLGMSTDLRSVDFIREWRKKSKTIKNIPPREVKSGPVMENVITGKDINILKFPTPRWHEDDGGRYIGTGSIDITRDPDEGWVNLGTYRVMVHDEDTLGFYISPGKHGRVHRDVYFSRGEVCKVAVSFGHDPLIFLGGTTGLPPKVSEYEYIGGIRGEPLEVIVGEYTGLPFPAHSEIVIEGESYPDERRKEGPFGEWTGYYGSDTRPEPVIKIKAIMHRNNPIILGKPPFKPSAGEPPYRSFLRSALLWDELELAGIPDVKGVWFHQAGGGRLILIVSIKQRYPGHAKQAAVVACQCHAGAYLGRYVIVVDEDIDPTDIHEVLWAVATRSDPERSIDIIRRCWSGPLDPAIHKDKKGFNSRAIIDATKPYEWINEFPKVVEISNELKEKTIKKWGEELLK